MNYEVRAAGRYLEKGKICRVHKLALWIGCLLLLLAAVMLATSDNTVSSEWSGQRLRVQQVLAGSAPCVTCHTAVSETPRLAIETGRVNTAAYAAPPTISRTGREPNTKIADAHAAEQVAVGARLLAVPARDLVEYTAVVDAFVAATEALERAETSATQREALRALDTVERRVLALEHQANPVRLSDAPDDSASDTDLAASVPPATSLFVALLVAWATTAPLTIALRCRETSVCLRLQWIMCGARRRGPPLGDRCRLPDSGRGRLCPCVAQSLFSCFLVRQFSSVRQI